MPKFWRCLYILLPLCLGLSLTAQEGKGRVYSARVVAGDTGQPLDNVICEAHNAEGKTEGYVFTDAEGLLRLTTAKSIKSFRLRTLGYAERTLPADSLLGDIPRTLRLLPSAEKLPEVVVSAPPIRQRGDTIQYQVSNFRSEGDRYIADVLRKLPGVQVADNGTITYQGEAINKFYVEGRDLMGGQYGLISRSLNVNAVSSVEVLERNQHIKALRSIVRPTRAAINLKLKREFKLKPFGEANLGGGLGRGALYRGTAMLANFSPALQMMLNLKAGNVGEELLSELEDKISASSAQGLLYKPQPLLSLASAGSLPLPRQRYSMGHTYLTSGRVLIPLSLERELKVNASHGKAHQEQEEQSLQRIYLGSQHLELDEQKLFSGDDYRSTVALDYEDNGSRRYIKSTLSYQARRDYSTMNLWQSAYRDVGGSRRSDQWRSQSEWLYNLGGDWVLAFNLGLSYARLREDLSYGEGRPRAFDLNEVFVQDKWRLRASANTSTALWGGRLGLETQAHYHHRSIVGEANATGALPLPAISLGSYAPLRVANYTWGISPTYEYKLLDKRLTLRLELPLTYRAYSVDYPRQSAYRETDLSLNPTLDIRYGINAKWEVSLRAGGGDVAFEDERSLLPYAYLQSYRTVYEPPGVLLRRTSDVISSRLKYHNILRLLFGNVSVFYRRVRANFTPEYIHSVHWSTQRYRPEESVGEMLNLQGELSKGVNRGRTVLGVETGFTTGLNAFVQQGERYNTRYHTLSGKLSLTHNFRAGHQIDYRLSLRSSRSRSERYRTPWLKGLSQSLVGSFFPLKGLELRGQVEHQVIEYQAGHWASHLFGDLSLTYKFKSWDIELAGRNLFDVNRYRLTTYSALDSYTQSAPLRGRELLLSLRLTF